ncbi:uncharacterized protein METZ01_LOCUS181004 [marine metagenome]|uniref:Uncharacterized protein n=1 Tax=marine metagenome TaxID=408172 RepID=A0A382CPU2_9ZZZZ
MGLLSWLFGTSDTDADKLSRLQREMSVKQKDINEWQDYIDASQKEKDEIDREVRRLQSALSKKNVAENRLKDKGL